MLRPMRTEYRRWWLLALLAVVLLFLNSPWFLKRIYPLPYRERVIERSRQAGLDPLLVAAVAREESGFKPDARSPKGALGIMQIMPETGRWAAGRMGMAGFRPEMLNDPDLNLQVGCWYLRYLEGEFEGNWLVVLAAYNAGRGNVQQWLADGVWDGSWQSLERIPFPQTRSYIERVTIAYSLYQRLYRAEVEGTPAPFPGVKSRGFLIDMF